MVRVDYSFRIGWFDLLVVQRTLKNLIQHHNSKTSILQHSVFFMVQLSHPYVTTDTRMETRLPWRPTRGSLTSPSYLVRKRTLGPLLEYVA